MFLRRYILFFCTLLSFTLQAQQYPVDVQVFVTPPYPQSLRGYADTFEQKIQAHFLLKDLSTGGRPFVLRFSLEDFQGQVIAQTPDYITPYLVNLSPGVRRTLTNIDFKTLLRYENLYGINEATYNGLLPEGTYFICLSLYDVATGRPVSNKGRAMIQVRRYSPPVLTMPQKGEVLTKKNAFQHIVFQWMPRDIAPFMQYEFTLKEVWDLALVPEEAFMTGRLVYQTKTFSPALAYTNMMPILLENKRYVWQVRAFTNNPNNPNEQSYFKNNGNSETFYFDLVSHCEAPKFLTAITESTSAQLRWSAQAMMPNQEYPYKVMYREKGKTWKSQKVSMPYAKLTNLKRGRTYIYKVGVACGLETAYSSSVFGEESYMYSTEQEFTTTEQIDEKSQVQCGVKPEIRIKNTNPLQDNLYPNTTFTAGDFPVTVLNATGNNGVYSGEGYVKVPYLQDTKIKVVFNGIKLNTERQLIEGKLVTTYDETERNVEFLQEAFGEIFGDKGKKDQKMPFEVSEVQVDTLGRIIVIGKVDPKTGIAPKVTLPKGRDYVITDSKGKVYQLDESGKVTAEGTREEGTQLAQQAGKGDSKNPLINNKHFKVEWLFNDELANDTNGEIPYKALVKGKTSSFELRIQPADTTKYDFFFHTENGVKVEAESKGEGLYKITRKGAFDFAQEELWVVAKEKKDKKGKKEELIGKCILVHLSPKEVNVALVPTQSGQNLQEAIAQVQQIYEKVGVTLHITTEKPFDISDQLKNGTLPTENEFGDLSTYSPEQNAVIAKFATNRKPKDNTYYIFLVNDGTGDHGYMRLGGQYGFVYSANARTIAHELGHGIFKLEHPFKGKNADKGKTSALMDYNEGQDFFYRDWKQINDPKVKLYAFQGQGEGEYHYSYSLQKLLEWLKKNKGKIVNFDPLSTEYRWSGSKEKNAPSDTEFVDNNKQLFFIKSLDVRNKTAKIDLSAIGNVVLRTGYSVEFGRMTTTFYMEIYYAQGKDYAIKITTEKYYILKKLLDYIGFDITKGSKEYIVKQYNENLKSSGNYDCNKVDVIFEDIPSFVLPSLDNNSKWESLKSLLECSKSKWGVDEYRAILNLLNGFESSFIYKKIQENKITFRKLLNEIPKRIFSEYLYAFSRIGSDVWTEKELHGIGNTYAFPFEYDVEKPTTVFSLEKKNYYERCIGLYAPEDKDNFTITKFRLGNNCSVFEYGLNILAVETTGNTLSSYDYFSPIHVWFGDEYSIILPAFVAYELVTRNALESPKKEFLKEASSLMLPELTLAKFKGLGSIFRYRKTTKPLAYVEKGVSKTTNIIGKTDETTTYINNLFKGARERAIAKFGKEAEELIYFKFNKDGGAAAEIIDHYGAEGLKALKKANKIDDVANELIKGKIAYRHIDSNVSYLEGLKKSGKIPENVNDIYFSLDRIDDPLKAIDKMQLNAEKTDAVWRLEFDANQLIGKTSFPKAKWNKAEYIEVITRSYPNFGKGGATQFITKSEIRLKRMINLKTGEIINFK